MGYLCDTCQRALSAMVSRYTDSEGVERTIMREYVICGETERLWVREKVPVGKCCYGYRKVKG